MKIWYWLTKTVLTILITACWAFLAVELMAVLLITVVSTGIDGLLWRIFMVTPGVGFKDNLVVTNTEVLKFLGFWGIVLTPIWLGIKKIGKIKFGIKQKDGAIGLTAIHVVSMLAGGMKMGWGVVPVLVVMYGLTMIYWWFYSVLVKIDEAVERFLG